MSAPIEIQPWDVHNQRLVANVRPPDWINPEPSHRYNLVVIGAGPAGLVTAAGAAGLGARVALVERGLMGGDCLNVGCVPSKALLRAARAVAEVRSAGKYGVAVSESRADFPAVMERLRRLRADISQHDSTARFRDLGVDVFLGEGRFDGRDAVAVGSQRLRYRKAVIATGARAALPPIAGLAAAGFLTNETVFSATELPRRLAVVGAGPVGCELAQAFARLGSTVALLEVAPRILPHEDADAAACVAEALVEDGIRIRTNCAIEQVSLRDGQKVLSLGCAGESSELAVDQILVGAGRIPNVEGLDLEAVGVAHDHNGVRVDDRLRTTNRSIFAAGDVCFPYKLTHAADATARIVIQNALFLGRARASALHIPSCTYTDPEVAHVGLHANEAESRGIPVRTFVQPLADVDRAILDGETRGFVKVHVRAGTDRIVGATVVARHAGEMLGELTLAMVAKVGLGTLARTIHAYPTEAEAIRKTADAYNRSRLTPRVKRFFDRWLAWNR